MHDRAEVEVETLSVRASVPLCPCVGNWAALKEEQEGEYDAVHDCGDQERESDPTECSRREELDVEQEEGDFGGCHADGIQYSSDVEYLEWTSVFVASSRLVDLQLTSSTVLV